MIHRLQQILNNIHHCAEVGRIRPESPMSRSTSGVKRHLKYLRVLRSDYALRVQRVQLSLERANVTD